MGGSLCSPECACLTFASCGLSSTPATPPAPTVFTLSRVSPLKERAESSLTLYMPAGPFVGGAWVLNPRAAPVALTDGIGVFPLSPKTPTALIPRPVSEPAAHGEQAAVGLSERGRGYPP